jgi:hypothetical protein
MQMVERGDAVRLLPSGMVSRKDAARFLGRQPQTLATWAMLGRGPKAHNIGGRCFYRLADLESFISGDSEGGAMPQPA